TLPSAPVIPLAEPTTPAVRVASNWQSHWRILVLAAFVIATALAAVVRFRRVHALSNSDTIVLADFTNTTGDVIFDGTLREGLAVQPDQSPFLNLVPDQQIQQTLRMMQQPSDPRLTPQLAGEVCHRTNSAAVLQSSISQIGSQYHLVLRVVNCSTGESI